ncbi:MAG: type I methionyl aminopeptidase [Rickettsiales bacterium]|jgi:methionyl aminopeptidase|nr:type I methionyl aminopeptidase [Rickettsiales bacterium]
MKENPSIIIHNEEDFKSMRKAGNLAASILDFITDFVKPGISTDELNTLCHDKIIENGAIPAPLHYRGFPKSICTSVNHVVCHGIPGEKKLREGDIVNIDVTVILNGWHGDTSRMFYVGKKIPIKSKRVVEVTYEAMMRAIEIVKPGIPLYEIGRVIEDYIKKFGYSAVREYCGHGIGRDFHTSPSVLHYYDEKNDLKLEKGMFFTIEPMINTGGWQTKILDDGWTVITKDNSLSAQFEHTIGVTDGGYEIFTKSQKNLHFPPYNLKK